MRASFEPGCGSAQQKFQYAESALSIRGVWQKRLASCSARPSITCEESGRCTLWYAGAQSRLFATRLSLRGALCVPLLPPLLVSMAWRYRLTAVSAAPTRSRCSAGLTDFLRARLARSRPLRSFPPSTPLSRSFRLPSFLAPSVTRLPSLALKARLSPAPLPP
eukprot:scaffold165854_cov28-Tisochrysis_lutea.AAC.1